MNALLVCEQVDCPFAIDGNCLEGFLGGESCPHLKAGSDQEDQELDASEAKDNESADLAADDADSLNAADTTPEWIALGGETALTLAEADSLASRRPCRVILVAGDSESGKTTLVVELYARFLLGPFEGTSFGGSCTLRALDDRHHPSRAASGGTRPVTKATRNEEGMRLLHLRLRRYELIRELLISDIPGELFHNVIDGTPVATEVPLAARADVCLVTIDGALLASTSERFRTMTRARLLLGGLFDQQGVALGTRTVLVVTKSDLLSAETLEWTRMKTSELCEWASNDGIDASVVLAAARPERGQVQGLDEVLDAIFPEPQIDDISQVKPLGTDREFWKQTESLS